MHDIERLESLISRVCETSREESLDLVVEHIIECREDKKDWREILDPRPYRPWDSKGAACQTTSPSSEFYPSAIMSAVM